MSSQKKQCKSTGNELIAEPRSYARNQPAHARAFLRLEVVAIDQGFSTKPIYSHYSALIRNQAALVCLNLLTHGLTVF